MQNVVLLSSDTVSKIESIPPIGKFSTINNQKSSITFCAECLSITDHHIVCLRNSYNIHYLLHGAIRHFDGRYLVKKLGGTCFANEYAAVLWAKQFFIRPFEKRDVLCRRGNVRPSVCPSVRPRFPDFSSTCLEISIWNLVYTFSRWHDMSSLSCITIGSFWPSLQPKVGQTHFLQSWPHRSR